MKITHIEIIQTQTADPSWRPVFCRVHTDTGIYGDGEAGIAYSTGASAAFGMLKDLAPMILGMSPLDNEVIWDKLFKESFWAQNGGPVVWSAISAIDMALWDIRGKHFGVPVYQLLGGAMRKQLRCYASQTQFGWGDDHWLKAGPTEQYVEYAKRAVADGYDAIKIDFFTFDRQGQPLGKERTTRLLPYELMTLVEERMSAVREAIGPKVDLIVENHALIDALGAVQLGQMAQKYNIFYYEEPCTPTPKATQYVHNHLSIPIAQGERVYSRWQYAPYFENGSVQVIQPDAGNCGGITETKKICDMAYAYDVSVQLHVCASPLSTAAALHVECVLPNFLIHEHHHVCQMQYNKSLCIHDYQPVGGRLTVPELPGLGNELSAVVLNQKSKIII